MRGCGSNQYLTTRHPEHIRSTELTNSHLGCDDKYTPPPDKVICEYEDVGVLKSHRPNVGLVLDHRLRRWPNTKPT